MIEDEAYRASSQYRYWSYTKESLARIRQNTNKLASERVKAAFHRAHAAHSARHGDSANTEGAGDVDAMDVDVDIDVETLTVGEELKIVEWGCSKIMDMGEAMNPRIPSHIVVRRSSPCFQLLFALCLPNPHAHILRLQQSNIFVVSTSPTHP